MTCGIAIRSQFCTHRLGHLGRCSWDKEPAVDPMPPRHRPIGKGDPLAWTEMQHGTRSGYAHGCECPRCRLANADYSRAYRKLQAKRAWRARKVDSST